MLKVKDFQYLSALVARVLYCPENSEDWGEFVIDFTKDELVSERMAKSEWSRAYLIKAAAFVSSLWEKQNDKFKRLERGETVCCCWS